MNTRGNKAGRNFLRSFFFGKSERTRCAYDDIERKDATSTKSFWKYCTNYEICFPKMQDESPGIEAERRREEKAERHGKGAERHRQKICRQAAPVWRIDGKIWHLWVCSDSRWTGSPLENGAMGVHVKARGRWADEVKFTSTAWHSHAMLWCPLGFFFLSCLYPTKDFGKCVFPSACEAKFHASF